jgi:hypothetical protein
MEAGPMTDPRITPFTTGPAPARYIAMGVVGRDGEIKAAYLMQQRVRHKIYSASDMNYMLAMMTRMEKARAGGWGGKC